MKTLKERIEIEKAFLDGIDVEVFDEDWLQLGRYNSEGYLFEWHRFDYRIKPETLEGWCNIYGNHAFGFYETKEEAEEASCSNVIKTIKLREIIDE